MKSKLTLLFAVLTSLVAHAQINFSDHLVSDQADEACTVLTADIDGDGDPDIVSGSVDDNKIAWYENMDGLGNFGPQQVITETADAVQRVVASDVDGDGDLDLLAVTNEDDHNVAWYENTDGQGTFGDEQIIMQGDESQHALAAVDIDGDGDIDVFSGDDSQTRWQENMDGQGTFGPINVLSESDAYTLFPADMDGDGDLDLLSAARWSLELIWFENTDGQGTFTKHIISTNELELVSVYACDIDGDNDLDILAGYLLMNGKIAWFENLDGQGDFAASQILTTGVAGVGYPFPIDLDGDNDLDVIIPSALNDEIVWTENLNGAGDFGAPQLISDAIHLPIEVVVEDIDGDGDLDVVSAGNGDDKITWHENLSPIILSTKFVDSRISVYPNPVSENLFIKSSNGIENVEVFTVAGKKINSIIVNGSEFVLDMSNLPLGVYFIKIRSLEERHAIKVVKI